MLAKRIDHTMRSHGNPLKTNAQRQSQSRIPSTPCYTRIE